jgi:hypothetical protein
MPAGADTSVLRLPEALCPGCPTHLSRDPGWQILKSRVRHSGILQTVFGIIFCWNAAKYGLAPAALRALIPEMGMKHDFLKITGPHFAELRPHNCKNGAIRVRNGLRSVRHPIISVQPVMDRPLGLPDEFNVP